MIIASNFISAITNGIRTLKVITFGKRDTRTPDESAPWGCDCNPVQGTDTKAVRAYYATTISNNQDVIVGYQNTQQLAAPGENRQYATNASGSVVFNIWQRNDGTVLMGSSVTAADYINHMTQWEALNTKLTAYISAQNTAIGTGIASAGGTYTPPAAIDISAAKLTKIKVE